MPQETILVVDDNKNFAETLIEYMLEPLDYTVHYAPNGLEGLRLTKTKQPDLILLDMNMPRMSGLQMLKHLRNTNCDAPVIFMTLHGSESVAVEAFRMGVRDYLSKPFSAEELQAAVDHALQETRLTREKEELTRQLVASNAVRQTTVTLSHYINNFLLVVEGGISLLQELLAQENIDHEMVATVLKDSQSSSKKIAAVIRVLQQVTKVQDATYYGSVSMIEIEAALKKELAKLNRQK